MILVIILFNNNTMSLYEDEDVFQEVGIELAGPSLVPDG